jgi:hypothetical protein
MELPGRSTSGWRRALSYFGLPSRSRKGFQIAPGRSRFGGEVSPNLEQELDELKRRVTALEERRDREPDG